MDVDVDAGWFCSCCCFCFFKEDSAAAAATAVAGDLDEEDADGGFASLGAAAGVLVCAGETLLLLWTCRLDSLRVVLVAGNEDFPEAWTVDTAGAGEVGNFDDEEEGAGAESLERMGKGSFAFFFVPAMETEGGG